MTLEREEVAAKRWVHVTAVLCGAVAAALLVSGTAVFAKTPQEKCQTGRYKEAARYTACQLKVFAKYLGYSGATDLRPKLGKCATKYVGAWPTLQAKASSTGVVCDLPRFVDNGDGTVTDNLTGLQWEQKTEDASVHDKDNLYSWSVGESPDGGAGCPGGSCITAADGTAFTNLLATLNGSCFAGQCDWRLPTVVELQTILLAPYPCGTSPCVDENVFGPTPPDRYWSRTTNATSPWVMWVVSFVNGYLFNDFKEGNVGYVRAVRGGL